MNNGTLAQSQQQRVKDAEAFGPLPETYSFKGDRIMNACGGMALGLVGLYPVVAHAPWFVSLLPGIFFALLALVGLWCSLQRPYELRIASSGLLRFASVIGTTDLCAADIVRLVRSERVSNGSLYDFRVEHHWGAITLDGREDVFSRLARLSPAAQVSKEKYDDTGD